MVSDVLNAVCTVLRSLSIHWHLWGSRDDLNFELGAGSAGLWWLRLER